jgi:protein-disulfide isomerase
MTQHKSPYSGLPLEVGPRDHIQGSKGAPVTLIEYGDYQCPYCGIAYPIVKQVQRRIGESICFVFRNFPLTEVHPFAEGAAEAAEAAGEQGKFWEMHDTLYENQSALRPEELVGYAKHLQLDVPHFTSELTAHAHAKRIREDFLSGVRSGVNGTPTFFINGVRHDGANDVDTLLGSNPRPPRGQCCFCLALIDHPKPAAPRMANV